MNYKASDKIISRYIEHDIKYDIEKLYIANNAVPEYLKQHCEHGLSMLKCVMKCEKSQAPFLNFGLSIRNICNNSVNIVNFI